MRLIADSALDNGNVDELAERLGIGSRHLRRLFLQHLGATPVAVAQTRRLHFAKRLIDETELTFTQIALASGFGSIRRFNATFQNLYGRTPTELRRLSRRSGLTEPGSYRFQLRYRAPFDWEALLAFLTPRAIPGVEVVDAESYRRTISLDGKSGHFSARLDASRQTLDLRIQFPEPRALFRIVEGARRMFDLSADPEDIAGHLSRDPLLARRVARRPGLRVPGAWDGFELAVRAILGQQVTVKGASTLAGRLVAAYGTPLKSGNGLTHLFPSACVLAKADFSEVGLPRARAETIRGMARAVESGLVRFSGIVDENNLLALPGVGDWTAQYIAMRALGEPDAFPSSDLGLLKASGVKTPRKLSERAERWRPWRAYAAMHLWQGGN